MFCNWWAVSSGRGHISVGDQVRGWYLFEDRSPVLGANYLALLEYVWCIFVHSAVVKDEAYFGSAYVKCGPKGAYLVQIFRMSITSSIVFIPFSILGLLSFSVLSRNSDPG